MKKQIKMFSILAMFVVILPLYSQVEVATPVAVDSSGVDKIVQIMSQIKHDVVPGYDGTIQYIQNENIDQDLNIEEIVKFFAPKTVMGSAYLQETLQRPVSPVDESGIIQLRQNIIQKMITNSEFKKSVEKLLAWIAEYEKEVIELMSNTFKGKTCPELEELKLLKAQHNLGYSLNNYFYTDPTGRIVFTGLQAFNIAMNSAAAGFFAYLSFWAHQQGLGFNYDNYAFFLGVSTLSAGINAYQLYDNCVKAGEKRSKIHGLNQLVYAAESLEQLMDSYDLETQFKISCVVDEQGVALIDDLKSSRYENKIDYCFNVPAVHAFLYKLYQNDLQLAQIFTSLAEIDTYNAIADKILASQNTDCKFCFAQRLGYDKSTVVAKGFWNVLVPGKAIANSVNFNQNMILTGPNAGGKTTSIRAILQNIVLAQTYGVAAAETFEYTPFDVILSYLNISDDLLNGYSLFASEIKRAKELLETIKNLPENQKLFFALDELFTGTAAENGEKCAYEFIKKIAEYNQILFVYATHFDKLKELGNQNIGLVNYKVDAPIKNSQGKLVYPYTLSPGASTVNVALDMAKEANLFD